MKKIVQKIASMFGSQLGKVVYAVADAVKTAFMYFTKKLAHVQKKDETQQKRRNMKTIDDICDNGSLDDLLDIASKTFILLLSVAAFGTGCMTRNVIELQPTRVWEGHYFTKQQFVDATQSIELKDGESVWVLSNHTLSRVLKETQHNK